MSKGKTELISHCLNETIREYVAYFQRLLKATPEAGYKKSNKGYYSFVPSENSADVLSCLIEVVKYLNNGLQKELKFLDCGCGIGNIMLLANTVAGFAGVHGIEYETKTCEVARALLPSDCEVMHDDILHFNHYADYNVIFFFTPIKDLDKRNAFKEKLAEDIKIGSVIISYGRSRSFMDHSKFRTIPATFGWAYEKIA